MADDLTLGGGRPSMNGWSYGDSSRGGGDVSSRRKTALKISRGQRKRGLLERMAQAEVNAQMRENIPGMHDVKRS